MAVVLQDEEGVEYREKEYDKRGRYVEKRGIVGRVQEKDIVVG